MLQQLKTGALLAHDLHLPTQTNTPSLRNGISSLKYVPSQQTMGSIYTDQTETQHNNWSSMQNRPHQLRLQTLKQALWEVASSAANAVARTSAGLDATAAA